MALIPLKPIFSFGRSSHPEVFLEKGVLKICSKFTGEHPCGSVISIQLQSNFTEITFRHGCSPVNLLHIFRTTFTKNNLDVCFCIGYANMENGAKLNLPLRCVN